MGPDVISKPCCITETYCSLQCFHIHPHTSNFTSWVICILVNGCYGAPWGKHSQCLTFCSEVSWLVVSHASAMVIVKCTGSFWVHFNSLAPGIYGSDCKTVISEHMLWTNFMSTTCIITFRWMPKNVFDNKSTWVQVKAWCHQAKSFYLSQCWPRFVLSHGTIRLRWVNSLALEKRHGDLKR